MSEIGCWRDTRSVSRIAPHIAITLFEIGSQRTDRSVDIEHFRNGRLITVLKIPSKGIFLRYARCAWKPWCIGPNYPLPPDVAHEVVQDAGLSRVVASDEDRDIGIKLQALINKVAICTERRFTQSHVILAPENSPRAFVFVSVRATSWLVARGNGRVWIRRRIITHKCDCSHR